MSWAPPNVMEAVTLVAKIHNELKIAVHGKGVEDKVK